jgi:hypothetical protein
LVSVRIELEKGIHGGKHKGGRGRMSSRMWHNMR